MIEQQTTTVAEVPQQDAGQKCSTDPNDFKESYSRGMLPCDEKDLPKGWALRADGD